MNVGADKKHTHKKNTQHKNHDFNDALFAPLQFDYNKTIRKGEGTNLMM